MKALTVPGRAVPIDLTSPCVLRDGFIRPDGYAPIMISGTPLLVHRVTYQLHVGPIPKNWQIDHVCHGAALARGECSPGPCIHRSCWNPAHLEAVSNQENTRRGGHPLHVIGRSDTCGKGHDMTVEKNVYTYPSGKRRCRVCTLIQQKARRSRNARDLS